MKAHIAVAVFAQFCTQLVSSACPAGSVEGLSPDECYVFAEKSLNWYDAEVECNKLGGYLASINSAFHEMYLSNASQHKSYWTGGQMIGDFPESDWRWSDASTWAYTSWGPGKSPSLQKTHTPGVGYAIGPGLPSN
ncbi:type-2 ice-structuring protein-like protein [Aphelenchoides avenae]|nr:type-2 ice-structuring protein-like protein [Aphelenchus avenae]